MVTDVAHVMCLNVYSFHKAPRSPTQSMPKIALRSSSQAFARDSNVLALIARKELSIGNMGFVICSSS